MSPTDTHGDRARGQYVTTARVEMDERRLLLRGGRYGGQTWVGIAAVGSRVFCGGEDRWSLAGIYVVTDQVEDGEPGGPANIAVPAFA